MTINELHTKVNELYQNNFDTMLKGFRENIDQDEISYDIEEVYEDTQSLGDLIDYLIEQEKCTEWDAPYLVYSVLHDPENTYKYFVIE
jgi:hypothetical protein